MCPTLEVSDREMVRQARSVATFPKPGKFETLHEFKDNLVQTLVGLLSRREFQTIPERMV